MSTHTHPHSPLSLGCQKPAPSPWRRWLRPTSALLDNSAPTFPEVHGLEDVSGVDAVALGCLQELGDLLHLLEGHAGGLDLLHWGLPLGVQPINELTQHLGEDSRRAEVRRCPPQITVHHPQLQRTTEVPSYLRTVLTTPGESLGLPPAQPLPLSP